MGDIILGRTFNIAPGGYDFWLIKFKSDGMIEWQKAYGTENPDYPSNVQETSDDGYILFVGTDPEGVDPRDAFVLKLDEMGEIEWE